MTSLLLGWMVCLKSIWKKAFQSARGPLGWGTWSRVFLVDFLPLPPCQQVTSCSSEPPFVHSQVCVSKRWRTITGNGSRRRGRHHLSAGFRLTLMFIWAQTLGAHSVFHSCATKLLFIRTFNPKSTSLFPRRGWTSVFVFVSIFSEQKVKYYLVCWWMNSRLPALCFNWFIN